MGCKAAGFELTKLSIRSKWLGKFLSVHQGFCKTTCLNTILFAKLQGKHGYKTKSLVQQNKF